MLTGPSMMQLPCRQSIIQQVWYQVLAHSQASNQYAWLCWWFSLCQKCCALVPLPFLYIRLFARFETKFLFQPCVFIKQL